MLEGSAPILFGPNPLNKLEVIWKSSSPNDQDQSSHAGWSTGIPGFLLYQGQGVEEYASVKVQKHTKTRNQIHTHNIRQFHVMLQRMFSPTINQTLPASIPQLQTAPHRRRKPNQWWVAWEATRGIGSKPSTDEV